MTKIAFKGNPVNTSGVLPKVGDKAPDFTLVDSELSDVKLSDFRGKNVVLNIFPSLDTDVCATSVRKFNEKAGSLDNTVVLGVSSDLPFASGRFCSTEGIKNTKTLSVFRNDAFAKDYGVLLVDGPLKGLTARAVVVVNPKGEVIYNELVPEITEEPDYNSAINSIV
ncbi:MAG: thiol peroxidase [Dysgonamonadaceae bacterium]|jgi:thiol peroxidase|nr:thiol peroxidase [Dysgonamonadaceae bacterium]MDD3356617.1 thiol peroxidase [Dysgonamonadaceae bacterium]MDD3728567.1 thiol peroxidase [Dysgonamonadaceae bacterium]MDD4246923.1 thiol peroxidase [Dysgonamonadaceae bacterium]MDD4606166.1 thiol peroxidase [Dysgonamonadaceae bacterium]